MWPVPEVISGPQEKLACLLGPGVGQMWLHATAPTRLKVHKYIHVLRHACYLLWTARYDGKEVSFDFQNDL